MAGLSRLLWPVLVAALLPARFACRAQEASAAVESVITPASQTSAPAASVRMARLTYLAGSLKVQRSDNTGEDGAVPNMPLREGTRLLAGDEGRAEVEFEDGSLVRLTPGSSLSLDRLALAGDVASTAVTLLNGTAYFELRAAREFPFLVSAGSLEITPRENVSFRVTLAEDNVPAVAVLSGTAKVERPEMFHVDVRAGESLRTDASDTARYFLDGTYTQGDWDWWNEERDQAASDELAHATAARSGLAGEQGYGWSDMDSSGTWYDVPGLGLVWQPYAADENFDPYGFGNWVYDSGGYVFASGYAWGWTPFRCGRWSWTSGFGWGWSGGAECGRWGFGGRQPIRIGNAPGHYPRPEPPPLGGHVHRIVAVRGIDGPRPPVLAGNRPLLWHGRPVAPLPVIGATYTSRGGSAAGRALLRDYPFDRAQRPALGVEAGSLRAVTASVPGWREEKRPAPAPASKDRLGNTAVRAERPDGSRTPAQPTIHGAGSASSESLRPVPRTPPSAAPVSSLPAGATHSEPIRPAPAGGGPVRDEPRRVAPPVAPVRTAPPAPAPVRTAPPAPALAPAHTAPANPK